MNSTGYDCKFYVIKQGDTLYSISRRFNVPIALLFRANPYAEIYNLQVGDEICIPVIKPLLNEKTMDYTVGENETIQNVMDKFGIDFDELQQMNDLTKMVLQPGTVLQVPAAEE